MDYKKLTEDLQAARKEALKRSEAHTDGGTANIDKVFLRLPRANKDKVLDAIKDAGMYCRGKRVWIGSGYMITVSYDAGDRRAAAVTTFWEEMTAKGYDAIPYRQMD